MQITLIFALMLHVLSGVFWAGTTFVLARTGGNQADLFLGPQMGAAAVAVVTGGVLWFLLHDAPLGLQGHILAVGALCALIAVALQGAMALPALRKLSALNEAEGSRFRHRLATSQRIAAAFLVITVTCMAAARYA